MNILMIGPQGSGKGTQARILCDKLGYAYFESGAFLRDLAAKNETLRWYIAKGNLVPDEEMSSYVTAYLDSKGLYDNIVFDGFPRSLKQYKAFKTWLVDKSVTLDLVFVLNIGEDETVRRLSARRMDPATGKIYNLITDPPPAGVNREALVQRDDDTPTAIRKRLALYKETTLPLIDELKKDTTVVEINGERPIEVISQELASKVKEQNAAA